MAKVLTFEYYFYTFEVPYEEGSRLCRDATYQRQKDVYVIQGSYPFPGNAKKSGSLVFFCFPGMVKRRTEEEEWKSRVE